MADYRSVLKLVGSAARTFLAAEAEVEARDPVGLYNGKVNVLAGQAARLAGLPTIEANWLSGRDTAAYAVLCLARFRNTPETVTAVQAVCSLMEQAEAVPQAQAA